MYFVSLLHFYRVKKCNWSGYLSALDCLLCAYTECYDTIVIASVTAWQGECFDPSLSVCSFFFKLAPVEVRGIVFSVFVCLTASVYFFIR